MRIAEKQRLRTPRDQGPRSVHERHLQRYLARLVVADPQVHDHQRPLSIELGPRVHRHELPPPEFRKQLATANCRGITFHDLRHTAASLMVMSGISLRTVQQVLGHTTIQMTERYAHLAPDFMARDAEKLALDLNRGEVIRLHG